MSMDSLKDSASHVKAGMLEKVKSAQEMRQEIDAMKNGLEGMPADLDAEITGAIEAAREQGRQAAASDISGVEQQARQTQKEGVRIQGEIDTKIRDNTTAIGKLEQIRSTRYGRGAETAIKAAQENTTRGESIRSDLDAAMQEAFRDLEKAKTGI